MREFDPDAFGAFKHGHRRRRARDQSDDGSRLLALRGKRSGQENFEWAARQAYIALGVGLVAAAINEVDATPMEGFDGPSMDKVLGLKEKGLRSVVLMALGYRDEKNDYLVHAKKVRKPSNVLFVNI